MTLVSRPVRIGHATYLRIPKDCEDLMIVMKAEACSVDFQIDEKGCRLVYEFARPVPELVDGTRRRPLWMVEKELLA